MFSITSRTTVGAMFLLIIPVAILISGWVWHPTFYKEELLQLQILYWITETVTQPWVIITHSLLYAWFLWCLRSCLRKPIILFAIILFTILTGQIIKLWCKESLQESRPFIVWLEQKHHIPLNIFYNLNSKDRNSLVKTQLKHEQNIPNFLHKHWQQETGFSFPSGHAIFAASWAILSVGLLWPQRCAITIFVLIIWANIVMISRLSLGMHRPIDLIVAVLIAWLLTIIAIWLAQKVCISAYNNIITTKTLQIK